MPTNLDVSPVRSCPTELYIDGRWSGSESGARLPVVDPATGAVLTEVADAGVPDAERALAAAERAQSSWALSSVRERADLLWRIHDLLLDKSGELAGIITAEMGKPLADAAGEVVYASEFFRWFAEQASALGGRYALSPDGKSRFLTARVPVGPTLLVTPWNFPLAMGARKIAPALAAGCTSIIKPAEQTPLTMLALMAILDEAGCRPGVVNALTTGDPAPVVTSLLTDRRIRKLSFTGSTLVGKHLLAQAAQNVTRVSLELGGNAPVLILRDADLDQALDGVFIAKFRAMGQACTAANRIYVATEIAEEFVQRFSERARACTVGPGDAPGTTIGPLIDADAVAKVHELVSDAVSRGADIVCGGESPERPGFYYSPTVLTGIAPGSRLLGEEIFGPVAPFIAVDGEDDMIRLANDTPFGLAAYVFTRDLDRGLRVADRLENGLVGINQGIVSNPAAPFGGVKQSGLGREGGLEGIDEFLETKLIATPA